MILISFHNYINRYKKEQEFSETHPSVTWLCIVSLKQVLINATEPYPPTVNCLKKQVVQVNKCYEMCLFDHHMLQNIVSK